MCLPRSFFRSYPAWRGPYWHGLCLLSARTRAANSEAVKPLGEADKAISASTTWRMAENEVERLLAAAHDTIREVPFFWVITAAAGGDANARIVNAQFGGDDEEFWVRWF